MTSSNYFSTEANRAYWSASQFKAFSNCEAEGLAQVLGVDRNGDPYEREMTDSLLIGSYVDAYFSGELDEFIKVRGDKMFTMKGELYAKFAQANDIIDRIESDKLMMEYLKGKKQVIRTAKFSGVEWKAKFDVLTDERIVDLKIVKDFGSVYKDGFGYRPWIEAWGYDIQGAIYQRVEMLSSGRDEPLPFFLVAATKERVTDIAVIQIPQHILDAAMQIVDAKIDRFDLIKTGELRPKRCEVCNYCKLTKVLTEPSVYEIEEAKA